MNICNTCALSLGAPDALCGVIAHDHTQEAACDNCSTRRMLQPLEAYGLHIPEYVLKALSDNRLTRKSKLVLKAIEGFEDLAGFMIEDLGPQVFDPHQALLEDRKRMAELMRR